MFHFSWLLGCDLSVDEQNIGFKGRHVDKMKYLTRTKGAAFRNMLFSTDDIDPLFY